MIKLDHVSKSYGTDVLALDDMSVEVNKGEFVFVVGLLHHVTGSREPPVGVVVDAWFMRLVRPGIIGAAVLLALHVFMLAGVDIGRPHSAAITVTVHHGLPHDAAAVAPPTRGHSMAVGCLAVLAGLLLWQLLLAVPQRRRQPLAGKPPAAPVSTPPTPPPITLGISRT